MVSRIHASYLRMEQLNTERRRREIRGICCDAAQLGVSRCYLQKVLTRQLRSARLLRRYCELLLSQKRRIPAGATAAKRFWRESLICS